MKSKRFCCVKEEGKAMKKGSIVKIMENYKRSRVKELSAEEALKIIEERFGKHHIPHSCDECEGEGVYHGNNSSISFEHSSTNCIDKCKKCKGEGVIWGGIHG